MIDKNKDVELYELVKNIKHIITVKHVENMKIFHVDLNLDIFLQTPLLWQNLYRKIWIHR